MALNKKSLINRILVGIVIFIVMIGMILLNVFFVNKTSNDKITVISGRAINSIIIAALILLSVIEMRRALGKERIPDWFRAYAGIWIIRICGYTILFVDGIYRFGYYRPRQESCRQFNLYSLYAGLPRFVHGDVALFEQKCRYTYIHRVQ